MPRALLDEMDAEHEVMAGALEIAREEMNGLVRDPSRARAVTAREAMRGLRDVTVRHLDHEETEIESFYLEHADHPEIKAMGKEFGKRSPSSRGASSPGSPTVRPRRSRRRSRRTSPGRSSRS